MARHLGRILSQMVKPELDDLAEKINLSEDEWAVFTGLGKGKSIIAIADTVGLSTSSVSAKIKAISNKIERLKRLGVSEKTWQL